MTSACEATHVHRVQTEDVFAQKMVCLEDALREFGALAGVLGSADATAVAHAVTAAASLPDPQSCQHAAFYGAETIAQRATTPDDDHTRITRDMLARVYASERVGDYAAGLSLLDEITERLQQPQHAALMADAMYRRGLVRLLPSGSLTPWFSRQEVRTVGSRKIHCSADTGNEKFIAASERFCESISIANTPAAQR